MAGIGKISLKIINFVYARASGFAFLAELLDTFRQEAIATAGKINPSANLPLRKEISFNDVEPRLDGIASATWWSKFKKYIHDFLRCAIPLSSLMH
jgi:hypothetical protein